jgi:hypothetical protein
MLVYNHIRRLNQMVLALKKQILIINSMSIDIHEVIDEFFEYTK